MKYLILLLILTAPQWSWAEAKKKTSFRKTQEVSFDGADVDGLVRSPDGAYLHQKKGIKFLPLYKVDKTFDRDIKSSVDYVK
jgi:hypothetical protein